MSLRAGSHKLGPADGSLQVRTFREGVAQKVGHDLVFAVTRWEATVARQMDQLDPKRREQLRRLARRDAS